MCGYECTGVCLLGVSIIGVSQNFGPGRPKLAAKICSPLPKIAFTSIVEAQQQMTSARCSK